MLRDAHPVMKLCVAVIAGIGIFLWGYLITGGTL